MSSPPRELVSAALVLAVLSVQAAHPANVAAQVKDAAPAREPAACDPVRALSLVEQELAESKAVEDKARRVGVMVRAAELLWPVREQEARRVFAEAFEVASAHFRERGDEMIQDPLTRPGKTGPGLFIQLPDQRFVVIHSIARCDSAWARELTDKASEETKREAARRAEEKKSADAARRVERNPGDKLLALAESLLAEDLKAALNVARSAFLHPPSYTLPRFLYAVAKVDRAAADAFYLEALGNYTRAQPDAIMALSAYPFATHLLAGDPRGLGPAGIPPAGFAPNPALQRNFVAAFLLYADAKLKAVAAKQLEGATPNVQDVTQLFTALATLETLYGPSDATFAARVFPLKEMAGAMLTAQRREGATTFAGRPLFWNTEEETAAGRYERVLEEAAKIKDPENRDKYILMGLQSLLRTEPVERLTSAADKLEDQLVRRQFLDHVYHEKSLQATKDGRLDEAARLADLVEPFDQRALLLLGVAAEGLRASDDRQRAITLLEEVVKSAQRAPDTDAKARALLGAAHLYTKFDYLRALDVTNEAVKAVNRLKDPDLSTPVLRRRIEGRTHGFYTASPAPGFTVENAFRELGQRDFDGALGAARNLEDKHLRATAVMALSAKCLEESAEPAAPPKRKTPAPKNTPPKGDAPATKKTARQDSPKP